ncbi:hypothetical protein E2C01_092923 [Portunus trituberculatus]|uniref:Uncharacterized protein n=1 Tax=Portunus trituberculatus TaxID=210409 RepID=A0A5B7JT71_PORTR|nr:hypothetical protein [Portunus trituberculatus]
MPKVAYTATREGMLQRPGVRTRSVLKGAGGTPRSAIRQDGKYMGNLLMLHPRYQDPPSLLPSYPPSLPGPSNAPSTRYPSTHPLIHTTHPPTSLPTSPLMTSRSKQPITSACLACLPPVIGCGRTRIVALIGQLKPTISASLTNYSETEAGSVALSFSQTLNPDGSRR